MIEIEIKARCDSLDKMERLLLERGATAQGERGQVDVYFSHPCRDFGMTDEAFRMRFENKIWTVYYKGPRLDQSTKSREEVSSQIVNEASFRLILDRLGFKEIIQIRKIRRAFSYRGTEVSLDQVDGLGGFVEIEIMGDNLEKGRREVFEVMKELGLNESERRSYLELLIEKGKG